jgi:hypothetical protein
MGQVRQYSPNSRRWIFIVDVDYGSELPESDLATYVGVKEFFTEGLAAFLHFKYDAFELSNAAKSYAHQYIQDHTEMAHWIYLDADIFPVNDLEGLFDEDRDAEIILSPHQCDPGADPCTVELEKRLLKNGVFNGGFLGVRRGSESRKFIQWFLDRCQWRCYNRFEDCFVDQLWLNLVPSLFKNYHILEAKGANIGYWNFQERASVIEADSMTNNPLYFLHFSGWNPNTPELLSRYSTTRATDTWQKYARLYADCLSKMETPQSDSKKYRWGFYNDGTPVALNERRQFAASVEHNLWNRSLNPFANPELLKDKPTTLGKHITRWLSVIYRR